jgi:hypothetical protein
VFVFSIFLCGTTNFFKVVQVCQFDNLQFFGVDQVAMLIHASLKTEYRVKSKVVKSKATIVNLRYAKQQPSRVQGKKMATKWNSM